MPKEYKKPQYGFDEFGRPKSSSRKPAFGYAANGKPIHARLADGTPCCGARKRSTGGFCECTMLCENGRCGAPGHGGRQTGRHFKEGPDGGRRSKLYKSLGIKTQADQIRRDPLIRSHEENIVLYEAMMGAEAEGATPIAEVWDAALDQLAQLRKAFDAAEIECASMAELERLLDAGLTEATRRRRVLELADRQRRHIESENKRETQAQSIITMRQMDAILGVLLELVVSELKDGASKRRVAEGFSRYMLSTDPRQTALN